MFLLGEIVECSVGQQSDNNLGELVGHFLIDPVFGFLELAAGRDLPYGPQGLGPRLRDAPYM